MFRLRRFPAIGSRVHAERQPRRFVPDIGLGDALESRALLAVSISSIARQTSSSLLNGPISDPIPLLPSPGFDVLLGSTQTFVGYKYENILIGGSGLKIDFASANPSTVGARPLIVQVNWGDRAPDNQMPFNPTFQSVFVTPPSGASSSWTGSIILPHIYAETDTFTAIVQILEAPLPGDDPVVGATAQIDVSVGHVVEGSQGLFLRGTTGADRVDIGATVAGVTSVHAEFGTTVIDTTTDKSAIYVEALAGADQVIAAQGYLRSLFADGGNDNDLLVGGAGYSELLGGPGSDELSLGSGGGAVFGAAGDDLIYGSTGDDELEGGSGNDTIYGIDGNDTIFGDAGDDLLDGGFGDDLIVGGLGADSIYAGLGDDILIGGYINVAVPNFPANLLQSAWASYDKRAVNQIVRSKIVQPASDLSNVPFLITANGRTKVHPITFGALVANDGAVDILDGGSDANAVVANIAAPRTSDIVVPVPRPEGSNTVFRLSDHTLATVRGITPLTAYTSSNGADIIGNPSRGTYLLNRTAPDGANLMKALNFQNGVSSTAFAGFYGKPAPGLYRILNLSDFSKFANPIDIFWADFNRPFIGYGVVFGGVYLATSDPFDPKNLYNEKDGSPSPSLRENNYLYHVQPEQYPSPFEAYTYDPLRRTYYQQMLI